jgi:hypothetical protein
VQIVAASRAVRASLRAQERMLSFRVSSRAPARLDFRSTCATRLSFRLNRTSNPDVYLGSTGRAPAAAFRIDRQSTTGVAGRILLSSKCPVVGSGCPPPKATNGTVRIETAPPEKGGSGHIVARARSDENGVYSANLAAGRYLLIVEKQGYPAQKPVATRVEAGVVTLNDLVVDTGIR